MPASQEQRARSIARYVVGIVMLVASSVGVLFAIGWLFIRMFATGSAG